MDESRRSEEIVGELEQGNKELVNLEREEMKAFLSQEAKDLTLSLLTAERFFGPSHVRVTELQGKVSALAGKFRGQRESLQVRIKENMKRLEALTAPHIERGKERLRQEIVFLKAQRSEPRRLPGDFSMKNKIQFQTNESAILKCRQIVEDAIQELTKMRHRPVDEIEGFTNDRLQEIRSVDTSLKSVVKEEIDFQRQEFLSKFESSKNL